MFVDPNTADVLNKALDLAKQGAVAGIETLKEYAPLVWQMARRQTLIEGVECFIGLGMVWIAAIALVLWVRNLKPSLPTSASGFDRSDATGFQVTAVALALLGSIPLILNGIDLAFNPDFWTVHNILKLLGANH